MQSAMNLLYYLGCIILGVAQFSQASSSEPVVETDKVNSNCSCGGFPSTTPEAGSSPLLSQSPGLVVKCNEEGETTCKNLCQALAMATKAKGPEILCNILKNANVLKLSAFYKVCDKPWVYAEMTAEEPLCCEDTKVKICPSIESGTPTAAADIKIM